MVCTAGIGSGLRGRQGALPDQREQRVDRGLDQAREPAGDRAGTSQVKSRNPQPPVPVTGAGSGDGDGEAGVAGARCAAVTAVTAATGRPGPAASARCEPPAATIRAAQAMVTASTAAGRARLRPGGPGQAGRRGSLIRRPGTSGWSR